MKTGPRVTDMDVIIGRNLRFLRLVRGITQQDLAAFLNVTFQQIQKYEKGTNRLPAEKLYRLHCRFGVGLDYFFQGASPSPPSSAAPGPDAPPPDVDEGILKLAHRINALEDAALKAKIKAVVKILIH